MSSPSKENEEPSSSNGMECNGAVGSAGESAASEEARPPAKRRLSSTVIEISDTESDDSDVCAVNSYQASADEVKRIRGADYSSSSSSSDYSSDSESAWEDDSILVEDDKIQTKAVRTQLNPRANRMEDPKLSSKIKSQDVVDKLSTHWKEFKDYSSSETTLTCEPFRLCLLHDFLANPDIINNIVDDMNTLDWSRKKMDLYEFHQTADLASLTWQRSIRGIYELLKTEVMSWMSLVTGLRLTGVSASCSLYGPGDHLLPHDDLLADRRLAFILYLAPWHAAPGGWAARAGGALELLARDELGPTAVVRRVLPRNNMLAFFKVGHDSFHQVGEVLSLELPRLSINGWFHGPPPEGEAEAEGPEERPPPTPPLPLKPHNEVVLMNQWIEPTYMSPRSRAQIQAQMERESEVCLRGLLQPQRCSQLLEALAGPGVRWEACGPAHRRRYARVCGAWAAEECGAAAGEAGEAGGREPHPAAALLRLAASGAWVRLLADCTDLALSSYERLELQRWTPGDYTLLPPRELYQQARLEAVLYLGVPARPVCGGGTSYVAPEEGGGGGGEALVSLPPAHNALGLVYCDAGAASFTKYLSKLTPRAGDGDYFYILACTYRE